jgi:hypothetical protein
MRIFVGKTVEGIGVSRHPHNEALNDVYPS